MNTEELLKKMQMRKRFLETKAEANQISRIKRMKDRTKAAWLFDKLFGGGDYSEKDAGNYPN